MTPISLPFASLVIETPPLQSSEWQDYVTSFLHSAGGYALMGLTVWIVVALARAFSPTGRRQGAGVPVLLIAVAALSFIFFAAGVAGGLAHAEKFGVARTTAPTVEELAAMKVSNKWWYHCLSAGGLFGLLGVLVPFVISCTQLRFRRIWALTRLSFIESIRQKVLWGFLIFLFLFLFPPKWFLLIKPEDEIRINVTVIHFGANAILLLTAGVLASFSLPTDIRSQTIHTIVTKPVERFEIVLGRFFGYLGLTTAVLVLFFSFAAFMIFASRVDPEAQAESMKARVPLFGELGFISPQQNFTGESVGREWEYRKYIAGGLASRYRAVWHFRERELDPSLAELPFVKGEFSFDIFRTTKGKENQSVYCSFFVITHQATDPKILGQAKPEVVEEYRKRTEAFKPARPDGIEIERRNWDELGKVAAELGYFEYAAVPVADYHTDFFPIPSAMFKKAMEGQPPITDLYMTGPEAAPRIHIAVRCDSETQFLGVAKYDFHLLAAEGNFYVNFIKGALGIWLRLVLVIGIAVTCSTYLNGVVSFLVTLVLTSVGFFKTFVMAMAITLSADMPNPGPADAFRKLISNESLGVAPDASNPTHQVTQAADEVFRWTLRRVISLIPDVERLTWQKYVANGFNVPTDDALWNVLGVFGYLLLWAILAHYLIKWREIATW